MPFFLVTHTSIVEADDEKEAAEKAIGKIRAGGPTTVAVKADETTTAHVTVAARIGAEENPAVDAESNHGSDAQSPSDEKAFVPADDCPSRGNACRQSGLSRSSTTLGVFIVLAIGMLTGLVGGIIIS